MTDDDTRPVARLWQLTGGDLHDPAVARAVCELIVPRVRDLPGYLGLLMLVDRARSVLRGAAFWDGPESEEASRPFGARAAQAMVGMSSARFDGQWTYEVVLSRFKDGLGGLSTMSQVDHLMVRSLRGGGAEGPATGAVEALRASLTGCYALLPCAGALLLWAPDRAEVLAASFWTDLAAAQRGSALPLGRSEATVVPSDSTSSEATYEVVVNDPITWPTGAGRTTPRPP